MSDLVPPVALTPASGHRADIDGLRAYAVLAVIGFHFGLLGAGFLGVDVFFVISGYLITGIIYTETCERRFSLGRFYLRRVRRILPLALLVAALALLLGMAVMLPTDMNSLAESVVATNFFGNNVLQALTGRDYWDVVNDYKPLMHTWSLGVEEQFYLFFPLLILVFARFGRKALLGALLLLTAVSIGLYLYPGIESYKKFYYLPFRVFELSIGSLVAVGLGRRQLQSAFAWLLVPVLVALLVFKLPYVAPAAQLLAAALVTAGILAVDNDASRLARALLQNRLAVGLGLISFSLYMWHQPLLAFSRYVFFPDLDLVPAVLVLGLTVLLSVVTYRWVERPFRDPATVGPSTLLTSVISVCLVTTAAGLWIYDHGGVIRDVQELDLTRRQAVRNLHQVYNDRIRSFDVPFAGGARTKVLVIGNSFARDWANVLLESPYRDRITLSYLTEPAAQADFGQRADAADVVFWSEPPPDALAVLGRNAVKLRAVGTKNFGKSNGVFFNFRGPGYYEQRTAMDSRFVRANQRLRGEFGERYIDLMAKMADAQGKVPVFTPEHKFISEDCWHLTRAGAQYFAVLFRDELPGYLNLAGARDGRALASRWWPRRASGRRSRDRTRTRPGSLRARGS